jgi:hypothetical protein
MKLILIKRKEVCDKKMKGMETKYSVPLPSLTFLAFECIDSPLLSKQDIAVLKRLSGVY